MARPAEKARAMMNKWVAMREAGNQPAGRRDRNKRPHLASDCEYLADAERFRGQIVREMSEAIEKIQNPGAGEHVIRELNDEINHKMREKHHWNLRIKELGGLDYNAIEKKRQIEEGDTQAGRRYRYFGAAKNLPGVKELLEKEEANRKKATTRADLYKNITPDYYGWRDEEDGVLLELESLAAKRHGSHNTTHKKQRVEGPEKGNNSKEQDDVPAEAVPEYLSHIPSQDDVAQALLEHRKKMLMKQFEL